MDLCSFTVDNAPLPERKWGVLDASLVMADGSPAAPADTQLGVLASYGPNVAPLKGPTFAAISTGTARAEGDPGYVHPQHGPAAADVGGFDAGTASGMPSYWLSQKRRRVASDGRLPGVQAEYPERGCTDHDDFFLALLTSSHPDLTWLVPDTNIAFDALGGYVSADHAWLDVCYPTPATTCPSGQLDPVGTGMGGWSGDLHDGAGTPWLVNDAPVVPGETIALELVVWDGGDHDVDSIVLIDRFKWGLFPITPSIE